ncbi:unnamed protein product (macronuclear) [Paramecium tetraurelia]|uniref:VPS9 domain-containing protein n=1 Tax=Paramecium tetraurelia TaxID=5888 RepID=A0BUW9_PARTE|nr:uncharacterized protein GSPATT00005582001 [Paramecium tetraurelia]CAK62336.1 unnamed protein product [Paramecium tetraurelia]|eukprot:XP_001429734.1 hypothetical protein (macronuclear) [Paramecium tetraurelia strain d4-2]
MNNYRHIDGDSGLMTSQFHLGDSPKAIIDYSQSERIETLVQKGITKSEIKKSRTGESQSLIEHSNMQLNGHLLPQITLTCQSPAVFDQIALELKQYNYTCIMREANQMMFLQTKCDSFCQKIIKNVCAQTYIASQSNNSLVLVKYSKQKLKIDALSGNYKQNEDVLLSVCTVVKRYNQIHKDFEPVDDMSHINPFAITAISMNRIYVYLDDNQEFKSKLDSLLQNINSIAKPKKQQLQKYLQESSQLVLDTFQQFKQKTLKYDQQYYLMAIEKVVFESVYDKLFPFYIDFNEKNENQFNIKKQQIIAKFSEHDTMEFLEIKNKYRLNQQYWNGIAELNKVDRSTNPRDKLRSIQQMLCLIKSIIYENSNCELSTMDDELPVMIYIILYSEFQNKFASIHYVDDFCNTDPTIETEKRTVTTLRVSLEYIANEWNV